MFKYKYVYFNKRKVIFQIYGFTPSLQIVQVDLDLYYAILS